MKKRVPKNVGKPGNWFDPYPSVRLSVSENSDRDPSLWTVFGMDSWKLVE